MTKQNPNNHRPCLFVCLYSLITTSCQRIRFSDEVTQATSRRFSSISNQSITEETFGSPTPLKFSMRSLSCKWLLRSSSEPKQESPSFFKVVRYPSAPHLSLPIAFVRRYLEKIPNDPKLKTATGVHSWMLKIEKIDGDYCFTHGWEKLVRDAQLRSKDILVFWLIDPFTFLVSFFDECGYEKDLRLINTNLSGDGDDEDNDDGDDECDSEVEDYDDDDHDDGDDECDSEVEDYDDDDPNENLVFQKVISEKTHKYYMALPKKFVEAARLENKGSVTMKDEEGKEWMMGLKAETYDRTNHKLSWGWQVFREHHKLAEGDICSFKFSKKEGVLILTDLLKNKRAQVDVVEKRNQGIPPGGGAGPDGEAVVVNRKRGRPPLEKHGGGGDGVDVKD